jgi:hypothetical protein
LAALRVLEEEAIGEMYASRYAFDWFDKYPKGWSAPGRSRSQLRKILRHAQNVWQKVLYPVLFY